MDLSKEESGFKSRSDKKRNKCKQNVSASPMYFLVVIGPPNDLMIKYYSMVKSPLVFLIYEQKSI